jgi:hypothetical protein
MRVGWGVERKGKKSVTGFAIGNYLLRSGTPCGVSY